MRPYRYHEEAGSLAAQTAVQEWPTGEQRHGQRASPAAFVLLKQHLPTTSGWLQKKDQKKPGFFPELGFFSLGKRGLRDPYRFSLLQQ